jgi:hypothetical protein
MTPVPYCWDSAAVKLFLAMLYTFNRVESSIPGSVLAPLGPLGPEEEDALLETLGAETMLGSALLETLGTDTMLGSALSETLGSDSKKKLV